MIITNIKILRINNKTELIINRCKVFAKFYKRGNKLKIYNDPTIS